MYPLNSVLLQQNAGMPASRPRWLLFIDPVDILSTRECCSVRKALVEVEKAVDSGMYACGFVAYEAAPAFDDAFVTFEHSPVPLVWFGIYRCAETLHGLPVPHSTFCTGSWECTTAENEYLDRIDRIRKYIRAGDTYQVNYTVRLRARFDGDPFALFYRMCTAQRSSHCAYMNLDDTAVCCASPELLLRMDGNLAVSRPMKGTAARRPEYNDDLAALAGLESSEKDRAENVMIVDMIRNDLGRVAVPGTVQASRMFEVEGYPTVFQMTSTVEAQTTAGFLEVMSAMFPCASITGAPKIRTMEIIREVETTPRGVYTGTIGCMFPNRQWEFNVAIRTVVIDKKTGTAEYGVGGGIVWDSRGNDEYSECLTKSSVLTAQVPECDLFETILWTPAQGYHLLDRHLQRLQRSCRYFGFRYDEIAVVEGLTRACESMPSTAQKARIIVGASGRVTVECAALQDSGNGRKWRIAPALEPVDSRSVFLYHKTTNRSVYDSALRSMPDVDDVILHNERGEVTETTIANIVIVLDGEKLTPPVRSGLLPGTFREYLLDKEEIKERVVRLEDLERAEGIFLVNSVRGWIPAELAAT